jgi:hypothetical protein
MNNKIYQDDSEANEAANKESKKIRLPFYKLEELKKQEEKKIFKNPNKTKPVQKVEWSLPGHTLYKKKKSVVVLRQIKEEKEDKKDELGEQSIIGLRAPVIEKTNNKDIGDKLKQLKYSIDEVVEKGVRLSRKQRRLQQAENTLGSFMSKEDKASLFGRKNTMSSFGCRSPEREFLKTSSKIIDCSLNDNNIQQIPTNNYKTEAEFLGKKKKRINKYKKAVYRYRLIKKKFIVENLLKAEENGDDSKNEPKVDQINKEVVPEGIVKNETINPKIENNGNVPKVDLSLSVSRNYPTNQNYYNYLYQVPPNNIYNNYQQGGYNVQQYNPYFNYYQYYNQFYNPYYYNNMANLANMNGMPTSQGVDKQNKKTMNLNPPKPKKQNMIINKGSIANLPKDTSSGFIFETINPGMDEQIKNNECSKFIKKSYGFDKDPSSLEGIEFNQFLKEHQDIKKININNLQKISDGEFIQKYVNKFEGVLPGTNYKKKFIREYVDQILSPDLDKRFSDFIVRMREIYFKKKQANPLKARRRYVVGLREVEKYIRLE